MTKVSLKRKEFLIQLRLGFYLNSKFKSASHVTRVISSMNFIVSMLRQIQQFASFGTRKKLVRALIILKILYCSNICGRQIKTTEERPVFEKLGVAFNEMQ